MTDAWDTLDEWWLAELDADPIYANVVAPVVARLADGLTGVVADIGCGDGRIMDLLARSGDVIVVGCDINSSLLKRAAAHGSVARVRLPDLPFADASLDGAVVVLSFEHFPDEVFAEIARTVRPGGHLVAMLNHPLVTAPGAASVVDSTDGEVYWRPGDYLEPGFTDELVEQGTVRFLHRPMGQMLSALAAAGWALDVLEEIQPVSPLPDAGLPTLLAGRWHRVSQ